MNEKMGIPNNPKKDNILKESEMKMDSAHMQETPKNLNAAASSYAPKIIRRRAKTLNISATELRTLSLIDLKKLAHKNYKELARRYHPDIRPNKSTQAEEFRRITNTDKWFQNLTESEFEKMKKKEKYGKPRYIFTSWDWDK